jgi:YebC/PmpR family DNA-binding regulatory protein
MAGHSKWANIRYRKGVQDRKRDTPERAILRGAGHGESTDFAEFTCEGYGPGGAAVLVSCLTDDRNRTVADIRHAFTVYGGDLGAEGSVAYLFNHVGLLSYPPGVDHGMLLNAALEAGAEDVIVDDDGSVEVLTDPAEFTAVRQALEAAGHVPAVAEVTWRSAVTCLLDEADGERMVSLLETLEDLDDVQNVYSNADLPAAVLERPRVGC